MVFIPKHFGGNRQSITTPSGGISKINYGGLYHINNNERIKARIERDKQRRMIKRAEKYKEYDNFDHLLTMQHYMDALKKCRRNVDWKGSVQHYTQNCIELILSAIEDLENGKLPKPTNLNEIQLFERGKLRTITPIMINDRITQRVICDYSLVPIIRDSLIYDNGASLKDKGVAFARKRMYCQLSQAVRKWGSDFYALTFDFKNFFGSIPHSTCLSILKKHYTDQRIIDLIMGIVKSYQDIQANKIDDPFERSLFMQNVEANEGVGICLGSQISQILALAVPNQIDHYIKDKRGVRFYFRYMDDGVLLSNDKEFLLDVYCGMKKIADELGLEFNEKKTHVVRMTKGFTFLKIRYRVCGCKIIRTLARSSAVRMRRRLKRFVNMVKSGLLLVEDVYQSFQSWLSHAIYAQTYHIRTRMIRLYNDLFDGYRLTKKFQYTEGGKQYAVLQANKRNQFCWNWNFV